MKTLNCTLILICVLLGNTLSAQTNFTASLAADQEVQTLYGNICCFYRVNLATDADGNAYVLSQKSSDSSIWVTKFNSSGTPLFNTRVGVLGFETDYRYFAKKIRVYDDIIYVLCTTIFDPLVGERQTIYTVNKNSGALLSTLSFFEAGTGYLTELVDLVRVGSTLYLTGNTRDTIAVGPGSLKIMVMVTDLNFSGAVYTNLGNAASTNYSINTESNAVTVHNGTLYLTGESVTGGTNSKIFIAKITNGGAWTEYIYSNSAYSLGGKGLNLAAENNFIYLAGSLRASLKQTFRTTVLKIDTSLSTLAWVSVSKNSIWPLGIGLTSGDVIYTVDYAFKVVGFSKSTGGQLFAKNDFRNYTQVYNQPVNISVLNNDQLILQGTMGTKVSRLASTTKIVAKYSTSGNRVYLQEEPLSLVAAGQPGFATALGLAYASGTDYLYDLYLKYSSAGQFVYLNGKVSTTSLRIAAEEQAAVSGLYIYPNPATTSLNIRSDERIVHWTVYNSISQVVADGNSADQELEMDCGKLTNGIYFIKAITCSGTVMNRKFVIHRY